MLGILSSSENYRDIQKVTETANMLGHQVIRTDYGWPDGGCSCLATSKHFSLRRCKSRAISQRMKTTLLSTTETSSLSIYRVVQTRKLRNLDMNKFHISLFEEIDELYL